MEAGLADVLVDLADVAAHLRPDIGVGGDRRAALELAVFLRQLVRRRDEHAGMALAQKLLGARLVRAVGVAVEEHDRDGFDAELVELVAERGEPASSSGVTTSPSASTRSLHLEAQRPLDQRHVLLEIQIVGVGPVDAADLVDVAEALGGHQRGLGAGALQDGVDGDGRAVQEQARRRRSRCRPSRRRCVMPSTRRSGVDSALPKVSRPVLSSNTAMSVKVPPMSAARRMLAPLPAPELLRTAIFRTALDCYFFIAACAIGVQRAVSAAINAASCSGVNGFGSKASWMTRFLPRATPGCGSFPGSVAARSPSAGPSARRTRTRCWRRDRSPVP